MSQINSVRFTCTELKNSNKQGLLKPDANGYYKTVLGGLNVFNSAGEFYTAEGVKELFAQSGYLQKRIQHGRLRGEYGHPKKMPGESDQAFCNRLFLINEKNVAVHFNEIYLDDTLIKNNQGQQTIAIIGSFIPSGPFADAVQRTLDNPNENISFSIRAFTDDKIIRGVNHRYLKNIVTWDVVNCPGIAIAEKWNSPSLEELYNKRISRNMLEESVQELRHDSVAFESIGMNVSELFNSMGWIPDANGKPLFMKW